MGNILTYANWTLFVFYTLGSIGGVVYLIELIHDLVQFRAMRRNRDTNEPWFDEPTENIVQLHPSKEAPISARFK